MNEKINIDKFIRDRPYSVTRWNHYVFHADMGVTLLVLIITAKLISLTLSADSMRHYSKYTIVIILVIAAVITPTSDVFTLSLVALPMWLLYEVSIIIVNKVMCST